MCLDREAKDRGAGPESGGGSSEAKQQGRETRVICGVTGNRSVSGRWQHRKQAGPSPLGGSSGRRQSSWEFTPTHLAPFLFGDQRSVCAGEQWELCPPAKDVCSEREKTQRDGPNPHRPSV